MAAAVSLFCVGLLASQLAAQTTGAPAAAPDPKITQIDIVGLKRLIKPNGKPVLINFWATWCDPCREEYPDLVKIDDQYKGKIDFLTVSLDEATEKDTSIPKFLIEMKAEMPAYLLVTPNEEAAMAVVSRDWSGGLPFTILIDSKGGVIYSRQGKVKIDVLKAALEKSVGASAAPAQK